MWAVKMYVFPPKSKHAFVGQQFETNAATHEPLAVDGPPLGKSSPLQEQPVVEQKLKQKKLKLEKQRTKRGKGRLKKGKNKLLSFSLLGSNSNGLKAKIDSLQNNINTFSRPSCIVLQETKLFKSGSMSLPGYQIFQLNRMGRLGGGLLTAIDDSLQPVLVSAGDDDAEILVVQI